MIKFWSYHIASRFFWQGASKTSENCNNIGELPNVNVQIQPDSQDQWQIVNVILESKSAHPLGMIFDGIIFDWIFSLLKILWRNVYLPWHIHCKYVQWKGSGKALFRCNFEKKYKDFLAFLILLKHCFFYQWKKCIFDNYFNVMFTRN